MILSKPKAVSASTCNRRLASHVVHPKGVSLRRMRRAICKDSSMPVAVTQVEPVETAKKTTAEPVVTAVAALEETIQPAAMNIQVALDTAWVLFCGYLVVFMNAGFACVESGFCRAKNCVNILAKNLIVFAIAVLAYYCTGFGLMFGDGTPFMGMKGFFLSGPIDNAIESVVNGVQYSGVFSALSDAAIPISAKFFFQVAFAGTAATIVSGAVAERIKFGSFCLFALLLVGTLYGVTGHWIWGNGWLAQMGFEDFAGCTAVHSLGGWAALVGAKMLGPRIGKFGKDATELPGHSLPLATLGCLILWLGWFGFNPGSTLAVDAPAISHIALITNIGACAGALGATLVELVQKKGEQVDLGMVVNGILAGLVSVTAACPYISLPSALLIGVFGGAVVGAICNFIDSIGVDDPVGAVAVHLGCGMIGTLAVGLFAEGPGALYAEGPARGLLLGGTAEQLGIQAFGIVAVGAFAVSVSYVLWSIVKAFMGLRVTEEEEKMGLDIPEHGQSAYVITT